MSELDPIAPISSIVPILPTSDSFFRSSVMTESQSNQIDESDHVLSGIVGESLFSVHEECITLESHVVSLLSEEEESEEFIDEEEEDSHASSTCGEADFDQSDLFTSFDGEAGEGGGSQSLFPTEENSKSEYSEEDSDILHKFLKSIKLQKKHIQFQKNKAKRNKVKS